MAINSPCHGCKEREIGCHGKCPRYAEFAASREAARKEKQIQRLINQPSPACERALHEKRMRAKGGMKEDF